MVDAPPPSMHDLARRLLAEEAVVRAGDHPHVHEAVRMSGYGMDEDLRKSREAGFSDHVVKPATVEQLDQSIRRIVGKQ